MRIREKGLSLWATEIGRCDFEQVLVPKLMRVLILLDEARHLVIFRNLVTARAR